MDPSTRIAIEHECRRLSITYAHAVDFGDADRFGALFAENGVLLTLVRSEGRAEIRRRISGRSPQLRSRHVLTNILIDVVDDHTATGITYLSLYRHVGPEAERPDPIEFEAPAAVGHYEDRFTKFDGHWLFAERRLELAFIRRNAFPEPG